MGICGVSPWCFMIGLFVGNIPFSQELSAEVSGPVVLTNAGSFRGLRIIPRGQENTVNAFLGIPYAEPPTGIRRFDKPKPMKFISGTFEATKKPPSCFQNTLELHFPWADQISTMSEDCLYLNIWTPERHPTQTTLKPVMFWIHGGGYTYGSSAMDIYDGQILSSLGDVVVVTMNYRLGALGFLNSLRDDAPGNVGLYDSLSALQWINKNVEFFGGDPKKITIFGESAGAMSSALIAISPLSKGLFQKMILQSGSSYDYYTTNSSQGIETGNQLAVLVGCANSTTSLSSHPKEVVACLRNLPATDLTKTYYDENDSLRKPIAISFFPLFRNDFVPKHPIDTFLSKNYTLYDTLLGVTKNEGTILFPFVFPEAYQQLSEGKLVIDKTIAIKMLEDFFKSFELSHPEKVIEYYFRDIADDQQTLIDVMSEVIGDLIITCPVNYLAEKYSGRGAEVQFFRFDHRPSVSPWPEWMGAAHFDEVQFVFGMPIRYPEKYQDKEKTLSEYMIRMWTNFAKSKDLKLQNGSAWPLYSRSNPVYATFETGEQKTATGERKEACEFWRPYFKAE